MNHSMVSQILDNLIKTKIFEENSDGIATEN
jgi:hypothetical protein